MNNNSADETTQNNFFSVTCLLLNEGTKALRLEFDKQIQHHHGNLKDALTYQAISQYMKDVYKGRNGKSKLLNESQYQKLYPKNNHQADSKTFDITLLAFLFRNLLRLTSAVTNTWPNPPGPNDVSLAADISRLTSIRNALGHIAEAKLEPIQFEDFWKKIETILTRLNVSQPEIDHCKHLPFSEEQLVQNQNALKAQILDDFEHLAERVVKKIVNRERAVIADSPEVIPEKKKITKPWPSESDWSLGKKAFQIDGNEVQYLLLKDTDSCDCQLFSSSNDQLQLLGLTKLAPHQDLVDHILETAPKEVFNSLNDDPAHINFPCKYYETGYKEDNLETFLQKQHQSDDCINDNSLVQMTSIELIENANDQETLNGIVGICNLPADCTLNQWYFIYCDTRIVSLKKLDKQRIAKMVTEMPHSKLAVNIQSSNIIAVLHGLPQETVDSFVNKLKAWTIISAEEITAIVSKLDNLITIMEDKSPKNIDDFVVLLKLREETFAIGCQLAYTMELGTILAQHQEGVTGLVQNERAESLITRLKKIFKWPQSKIKEGCSTNHAFVKISSQGLNKSMIEQNIDNFKAAVLRVEEINSISEGSINIDIKIQDEWELANLRRDIECGLFMDRYCCWLQEHGGTIPEGEEIEVTLTYGGTVELIYLGIATSKKKHSETEDSMPKTPQATLSDQDVIKLAENQIKELTNLDKRRIKRKLEEKDGTSVHYIAINMVSQNIINVLYQLYTHDNSIIPSVLLKLESTEVISAKEKEDLDHKIVDEVRCLEDLVDLIALKDGCKIHTFIEVVTGYSVKLGEHIKSVWEYSKNLNPDAVVPTVICDDYSVLTRLKYVVGKSVEFDGLGSRLRVVGYQLWVTTWKALYKYTWNCDLVSTIMFHDFTSFAQHSHYKETATSDTPFLNEAEKEISYASATLQTERGDMLVADRLTGIHLLHVESKTRTTISKEGCADLAEYQSLVYGLMSRGNKVTVLEYNSSKSWNVLKDISLSGYSGSPYNRMYIHNNAMYISSCDNHCIYVYNMTCILLATHGKQGWDTPGLLDYPNLCSIDSKGTALVVDGGNHPLQLCTSKGYWSVVTLLEEVNHPVDAAVYDTAGYCLWVLARNKLHKLVRK